MTGQIQEILGTCSSAPCSSQSVRNEPWSGRPAAIFIDTLAVGYPPAVATTGGQKLHLSAHARAQGVKSIAVLEASKGLLVLLAGFELLHLVHHDLQTIAEEIVRRGHLNPARHYPRIFIEAASRTSDARLKTLAALAFAYSTVRFVEAYGLWHMRRWAEWFAVISGTIYVPLEIFEIGTHVTAFRVAALLLNVAIVAYLLYVRLTETEQMSQPQRREST